MLYNLLLKFTVNFINLFLCWKNFPLVLFPFLSKNIFNSNSFLVQKYICNVIDLFQVYFTAITYSLLQFFPLSITWHKVPMSTNVLGLLDQESHSSCYSKVLCFTMNILTFACQIPENYAKSRSSSSVHCP